MTQRKRKTSERGGFFTSESRRLLLRTSGTSSDLGSSWLAGNHLLTRGLTWPRSLWSVPKEVEEEEEEEGGPGEERGRSDVLTGFWHLLWSEEVRQRRPGASPTTVGDLRQKWDVRKSTWGRSGLRIFFFNWWGWAVENPTREPQFFLFKTLKKHP